jgi:stalled ribosome rescue protein Dom34
MHRHVDLSSAGGIKAIILASPGFLKDDFLAYM